jgi:hypothetical protein
MSSQLWPVTLPQKAEWRQYSATPRNNKQETEMDQGAIKSRRRFTTSKLRHFVTIQVDSTELGYFKTFYNDTLENGTKDFEWIDQVSGIAQDYIIIGTYDYKALSGSNFEITFVIEEV